MADPKPPAILFSGVSGLSKQKILKRFQEYLFNRQQNFFPGPKASDPDLAFPIIEIPGPGFTWSPYTPPHMLYTEVDSFSDLTARAIAGLGQAKPHCFLLHSHLTYFRSGQYLSWLNAISDEVFDKIFKYFELR